MQLSDIGEFGLIRRFAPRFAAAAKAAGQGIGDDCAVLPLSNGRVQLVTTDLLLEDRHFLRDRITPANLGHKSLAVNLSDMAAMGGTPTAAFLSLGLPAATELDWIDRFFDGLRQLTEDTGCPLLGGDTTRAEKLVINITVLGEMAADQVKYRAGAQPGDVLAVTGALGDSAGGLRLLLEDRPLDGSEAQQLLAAHHRPQPQLAAGRWLATRPEVHAMLDVSDGVDSDVRHIMERSDVGAQIALETLPVSAPLKALSQRYGWPTHECALTGGEDYVLLCSIAGDAFGTVAQAFTQETGTPLQPIGKVTPGHQLTYTCDGKTTTLAGHGFDHFR